MNDIERRNATYDAFVKMMAWVEENAKGLWDATQRYCVSYDDHSCLDWELNIEADGTAYLKRNVTNHPDCILVVPGGFESEGLSYYWNRDKACWVSDSVRNPHRLYYGKSMYAIDGMLGMANRWQDVKKWINIRKENCNAVLNFEV